MRNLVLIGLAAGLLLAACNEHKNRLYVDPEDIEPACAAYSACFDPGVGIGICRVILESAPYWNTEGMSFTIGTVERKDWINVIGGAQNARCIVEAGNDCDRVLACMNQGRVVRDCTPPEGHLAGRYCLDEGTVATCTNLGPGGQFVETSFRCADIEHECVEMQREEDVFAVCGNPEPGVPDGITVSCDGSMAKLNGYQTSFYWDCANNRADCVPGSYPTWDHYPFCQGDYAPCEKETLQEYCNGDLMVNWCNGEEVGFDCTSQNQFCRMTRILTWEIPFCTYDTDCNPYNFEETCQNGIVTYCGPDGVTELDCRALGFSGCSVELFFASCEK